MSKNIFYLLSNLYLFLIPMRNKFEILFSHKFPDELYQPALHWLQTGLGGWMSEQDINIPSLRDVGGVCGKIRRTAYPLLV